MEPRRIAATTAVYLANALHPSAGTKAAPEHALELFRLLSSHFAGILELNALEDMITGQADEGSLAVLDAALVRALAADADLCTKVTHLLEEAGLLEARRTH